MSSLLIAAGLAGLLIGADLLVRGGAALASDLGVRPIVVGLTAVERVALAEVERARRRAGCGSSVASCSCGRSTSGRRSPSRTSRG